MVLMSSQEASRPRRRNLMRIILIFVLVSALLVFGLAAAVLLPIVLHESAGGSGQELPADFSSSVSATGDDGRERSLSAETIDGSPIELDELAPGETVVVRGAGFDASIGIYVAFCQVQPVGTKPGPCLGGVPEGATEGEIEDDATLSSAWITNDWAWRSFATGSYLDDAAGTFEVTLTVPDAVSEGLDCTEVECALTTRADHTAASDRVQDMRLRVSYG